LPAQSVAAIHRRAIAIAIATEQGWSAPSYGTVYAIVRRLHPGLVTSARDGSKAYGERLKDQIYRARDEGTRSIHRP
jgi:hypothetical protein